MLEQTNFTSETTPLLTAYNVNASSYLNDIITGLASALSDKTMPVIEEAWLSNYQPLQNNPTWASHSSEQLASFPSLDRQTDWETGSIAKTHIFEDAFLGEAFSTVSINDELLSPQNSTQVTHWQGTLRADQFSIDFDDALTVISGNGNVDYGDRQHDFLNLTNISYHSVAEWSWAESGGVVFDVGNGDRVFDSLLLSNGSQVLFEGLDSIQFSDGWFDLSIDTNDLMFGEQWNLHMMGVQNAWRFTQGSSDVLVGIQDTGLGYNSTTSGFHADIETDAFVADNVVDDFFREIPGERYGPEDFSHGTSVQSIISATSNNGYGMSGINWNSDVVSIDVLGGNRDDMNLGEAAQSMIDYAEQLGKKLVINMSLGGSGQIDPVLERLVADNQDNALFVIANGNDGESRLSNPAALSNHYGNVMGIGASWGTQDYFGRTTQPGDRIDYTRENGWGSNYGYGISLMGPSEVIAATASPSQFGTQFGWTDQFNGTSAAAPNIAGVASLVWSIDSRFSANQINQILQETAYDLGQKGYDYETGAGFVNADGAVRRAMALSRAFDAQSSGWNISLSSPINSSVMAATDDLGSDAIVDAQLSETNFIAGGDTRSFRNFTHKPVISVSFTNVLPIQPTNDDNHLLSNVTELPIAIKETEKFSDAISVASSWLNLDYTWVPSLLSETLTSKFDFVAESVEPV